MKFLLLTVGLALIGAIQAIENIFPKKDVEIEKLVGKWHIRQEAMTNTFSRHLLDMDIKDLSLTSEANLKLVMLRKINNKCVEQKFLAKKTEKPAEYEIMFFPDSDLYRLSVIDTDYNDYFIFCLENINSQENMACSIYVRRLEKDYKGMEKFKQILRNFTTPYTEYDVLTKDMCRA